MCKNAAEKLTIHVEAYSIGLREILVHELVESHKDFPTFSDLHLVTIPQKSTNHTTYNSTYTKCKQN